MIVAENSANSTGEFFVRMAMVRPTFLVAEPRPQEGISARKLVLETALFNVITAYDGPGTLQLLEKFPNVDALVVHAGLGHTVFRQLIEESRRANPERLIVLVSPGALTHDAGAHYHLSSHDPKQLLDLMMEKFDLPEDE